MNIFQRSFVNPLLALAFKDGIDFVADPDCKALTPKQEGDKWVVIIEHESDDEDDDESPNEAAVFGPDDDADEEESYSPPPIPEKRRPTFSDYQDRFKKMTPVTAKTAPGTEEEEIIYPPVMVEPTITNDDDEDNSVEETERGCGQCVPCSTGADCIRDIEVALAMGNYVGRER